MIDTNVLLFVAYLEFDGVRARAMRNAYSGFLQRCKQAGSRIYVCGLSYPELANAVERFRWLEYGGAGMIDRKDYRALADQRQLVVADVKQIWSDAQSLCSVLDVTIDRGAVGRFETLFGSSHLDGYDGYLIEAARQAGVPNVVTDDRDFATASNLIVFTANHTLLN